MKVKNNDIFNIVIDGVEYIGTMAEISYQYCKKNDIRLFIEPDEHGESFELFAEFLHDTPNIRTYIACFEDMPNSLDNALKLFFTEFLADGENYMDYAIGKEAAIKKTLEVLRHDKEYQKHLQRAEKRINTLLCEHGYNFGKETE